MENYKKTYDMATQKLLRQAAEIDRVSLSQFDAQYTLHDIVYVLRNLYADEKFRRKFVGQDIFRGFVPWTKGGHCPVFVYMNYTAGATFGNRRRLNWGRGNMRRLCICRTNLQICHLIQRAINLRLLLCHIMWASRLINVCGI